MNVVDTFFHKKPSKTSHESLATLSNGSIISGYQGFDVSYYTHINYYTMRKAVELLIGNTSPSSKMILIETGSAAHGTQSTLLWDKLLNSDVIDGHLYTVDMNPHAVNNVKMLVSDKTTATCSDSLLYLPTLTEKIDFVYFDSYDCDFMYDNGSAVHHMKEFKCIEHLLKDGTVLLVDDTPINRHWMDNALSNPTFYAINDDTILHGKGNMINSYLETYTKSEKVMHQYQTLWIYHK